MDGRQEDALTMCIVVESEIAATDSTVLALMPEFDLLVAEFNANVSLLRANKIGQRLNRTGFKITKVDYRSVMSQQAFTIAASIWAYAVAESNDVLKMEVTFTESDFERMRDSDVADTCQGIYDIAEPLFVDLTPYGITVDVLNDFKSAIEDYNEYLPLPRTSIITKKMHTQLIADLFASNAVLLERMDGLVRMLKFKQPVFFNNYFSSRKVIATGGRTLSLRGFVTDVVGVALEKVVVTVDSTPEFTTKSTKKGSYRFKSLPAGVWPVTFKREGYISETVYLSFTPTLRMEYSISLKRIDEQALSA